jgi:hypothetical protein
VVSVSYSPGVIADPEERPTGDVGERRLPDLEISDDELSQILESAGGANVVQAPAIAFTPRVTSLVMLYGFLYSVAGLLLGLVCALLGVLLFFHGVTGSTGWVVQLPGLKSSLSDAAPGVILFVVGLAVVYLTRFEVRTSPSAVDRLRDRARRRTKK